MVLHIQGKAALLLQGSYQSLEGVQAIHPDQVG